MSTGNAGPGTRVMLAARSGGALGRKAVRESAEPLKSSLITKRPAKSNGVIAISASVRSFRSAAYLYAVIDLMRQYRTECKQLRTERAETIKPARQKEDMPMG